MASVWAFPGRAPAAGADFPSQDHRIQMSDGREVKVVVIERAGGVLVTETFDAETENTPELQRTGWQAILDNVGRHVEAKS